MPHLVDTDEQDKMYCCTEFLPKTEVFWKNCCPPDHFSRVHRPTVCVASKGVVTYLLENMADCLTMSLLSNCMYVNKSGVTMVTTHCCVHCEYLSLGSRPWPPAVLVCFLHVQ